MAPARRRPPATNAAELHRQWLELVDIEGPFLAIPPLKRVWPNGIPDFRSNHPDRYDVLADARNDFETAWESLDRTQDGGALVEIAVPVRTVDALVGPGAVGALVVKIDTEGSEADVLAGMAEVLASASEVVAIVEFDPAHLRRRGTDPGALFATLAGIGTCWAVDWEGRAVLSRTAPSTAADLLVASEPATATALGLPA